MSQMANHEAGKRAANARRNGPTPPRFWRHVALLGRKELQLEGAGRGRLANLLPFAALVCLLFSFAVGPQPALLQRLAPGFLWLAVLLASLLGLAESMAVEHADGALEGLRLLGISPTAIFLAKASANWLFLFLLSLAVLPLAVALYDAPGPSSWPQLLAVLALGTGAISAPGTLFAALTAELRGRDLLLPLLMLPLLVPGLLAAVRATSLLLLGDPMDELFGWQALLCGFQAVYWPLCTVLFERVVEA